jgi:hypothetical protein
MGEFSLDGRLLTLGSFSKITEVAHKFLAAVFQSTDYVLILTKNLVGLHFGRFSQTHLVILVTAAQKLDWN